MKNRKHHSSSSADPGHRLQRIQADRTSRSNDRREPEQIRVLRGNKTRKHRAHRIGTTARLLLVTALVLSLSLPIACHLIDSTDQGTQFTSDAHTTEQPDSSATTSNSQNPDTTTDASNDPASSTTESTAIDDVTQPTAQPTKPPAESAELPPLSDWTDAQISGLDGSIQNWSFNRPAEKNKDLPATLPQTARALIEPFAVIWQLPATGSKTVYLTMDEGYEYKENTTAILDIAAQKQVPITFFITDYFITTRPDLVERMANEGHCVANHTMNHPNLSELLNASGQAAVMKELTDLEQKYTSLTGRPLERYIRPPMGAYNQKLLALLNREGFYPVFWSFAYRDWLVDDQPEARAALDLITGELHDGSVILIHAVSETNVEILPALIDEIRARGYEPAALPSLHG